MKRTILFFALFTLGLVSTAQTLNTEQWIHDLDYLNGKIQRQFDSFTPGVKEQFQSAIEQIKSGIDEMESHEVTCEIMRALAMLKDGHTELNIGHRNVGFHRMPLLLYFFEGNLRVIAAHEEYEDLLGAKIIGIGNSTFDEVFEMLTKRMSADNAIEYLHAGPGYLILTELLECMGVSDDPIAASISFELTGGETRKVSFQGLEVKEYQEGTWKFVTTGEQPLYLSNGKESYWFKWLPDEQIMYVQINRLNNQKGAPSIKKFSTNLFKEIDKRKPAKVIFDVRKNNGGNYHLSRPIVNGIKNRDWLNQQGKVWFITGRRTFSAASTMGIFLKKETETILIGEPGRTHPNLADNNEYMNLPNSDYLIEYTTKIKKHWPERPELTMIPVDVEILPDFESYKIGKDKVMEYLIQND
ncbi:MAG: hypothetical protein ABJG47_15600 [Ekhidna sp.]